MLQKNVQRVMLTKIDCKMYFLQLKIFDRSSRLNDLISNIILLKCTTHNYASFVLEFYKLNST